MFDKLKRNIFGDEGWCKYTNTYCFKKKNITNSWGCAYCNKLTYTERVEMANRGEKEKEQQAYSEWKNKYEPKLGGQLIPYLELRVLSYIYDSDSKKVSYKELAGDVSLSNPRRLLVNLEQRGYIKKDDGWYQLSPEGNTYYEKVLKVMSYSYLSCYVSGYYLEDVVVYD